MYAAGKQISQTTDVMQMRSLCTDLTVSFTKENTFSGAALSSEALRPAIPLYGHLAGEWCVSRGRQEMLAQLIFSSSVFLAAPVRIATLGCRNG